MSLLNLRMPFILFSLAVLLSEVSKYRYLMATDPLLRPHRGELQVNPKFVVMEQYGVALR